MTDRIDHAAEARKHIDWAHEQQEQEGDMGNVPRDNALLAQAEATLALVEQQRIANLIALATVPGSTGTLEVAAAHALVIPADDTVWESQTTIRPEIREALGL